MASRAQNRRNSLSLLAGLLLLAAMAEAEARAETPGPSECTGLFARVLGAVKTPIIEFKEELKAQGPRRLFIRERKSRDQFSWGIFMDPLTSPLYLPGEILKWRYAPAIVPDLLAANYIYGKLDSHLDAKKESGLQSAIRNHPGVNYLASFAQYGAMSSDDLIQDASAHITDLKEWASSDPKEPHRLARERELMRLGVLRDSKDLSALDDLAREAWNEAFRQKAGPGGETFPERLNEVWAKKLKSSEEFSKRGSQVLSLLSTFFLPVVPIHGKTDVEWTAALLGLQTSIHGDLAPFTQMLGKEDLPRVLISASQASASR